MNWLLKNDDKRKVKAYLKTYFNMSSTTKLRFVGVANASINGQMLVCNLRRLIDCTVIAGDVQIAGGKTLGYLKVPAWFHDVDRKEIQLNQHYIVGVKLGLNPENNEEVLFFVSSLELCSIEIGSLKNPDAIDFYLDNEVGRINIQKRLEREAELQQLHNSESRQRIQHALDNKTTLKAKVINRIKAGFEMDLLDLKAFMPFSHSPSCDKLKMPTEIGDELEVVVLKLGAFTMNIVVSYTELEFARTEFQNNVFFRNLVISQQYNGVVDGKEAYGLFVKLLTDDNIPTITGLAHKNDFDNSYAYLFCEMGNTVRVTITDIDTDTKKIRLSVIDF